MSNNETETTEPTGGIEAAGDADIGNRAKNPNFRWYVVHTYSMFEEKAKSALLERVKLNKLDAKFGDIFVPKTATETMLKSGKKKKVERNAFPGYIIVEMEMDEITNHLVRDTPKITGFVGNARNPRPISDAEVLRLTSPETVKEQAKAQAATQSFEKGETVKVIDGAFTNFDGVVEAVQADKMKLRILVSIFGRETPVELDYGQVQKLT
jgi:transcriptional antiterminator NusG